MGALWGIVLGNAEVGGRWARRLAALGLDTKDDGKSLVQYMGKKQILETVESNCLVGEFCWVTRLISE
jgi:hypothetical protein